MKTTVELPDELLREAHRIARAEGSTLKLMLEEGLRAVIARYRAGQHFQLRDASVPGNGLSAEFEEAGWVAIRSATYGDRL